MACQWAIELKTAISNVLSRLGIGQQIRVLILVERCLVENFRE